MSTITVGLNENARQSSRVQRGDPSNHSSNGHTNIFGDDPEPPRMRTGRRRAPDCNAQAETAAPENQAGAPEQSQMNNEGQKYEEKQMPKPDSTKTESPKQVADPQKRVRVPPGGFSAGFW